MKAVADRIMLPAPDLLCGVYIQADRLELQIFYALAARQALQLGWTGCNPLRRPPPAPPPQEGVFRPLPPQSPLRCR